jgi:hypothetical protein
VAAIAGLFTLKAPLMQLFPPNVYARDLIQPYLLARAIRDGVDPYLSVQVLADRYFGVLPFRLFPHPTPHPPTVGIVFVPLSFLDYQDLAWLWFGLELMCIAGSVWLLARLAKAQIRSLALVTATLILCGWFAFNQDLYWGQFGCIQLLLLIGALYNWKNNRKILCGILLGLALLIKPLLWPIGLLLLLRKEVRCAVATVVTVVAGYTITGLIIGMGMLVSYFLTIMPAATSDYRGFWANWSAWSIGPRFFVGMKSDELLGILKSVSAPPLLYSELLSTILSLVIPALLLFIGLFIALRLHSVGASFSIMVCVSLLVSPVAWSHYMTLLLVPLAWIAAWLYRYRFPIRETNSASILGLLLFLSSDMFWELIALTITGQEVSEKVFNYVIPFWAGLLTLMPCIMVIMLAILIAWLGFQREQAFMLSAEERSI